MIYIPTLYDLSLEAVVDCFTEEIPPTNRVDVIPEVQENIFEGVMKARAYGFYGYDAHTKALMRMLQPTKLDFNFKYIKKGTFDEIQKLKLTELRIVNFELISKYRKRIPESRKRRGKPVPPTPYNTCFDIGRFLREILSHETQQGLRVLDLSGRDAFRQNWMAEVSSMFPNLEVLNVNNRKMSEADFTNLCDNLPNLRSLDIRSTNIKNLNGISKLQSLEKLNINFFGFEKKEDVEELSRVRNLKKLIFANSYYSSWNNDWLFERPLPMLTTLVCQWPRFDNGFLRRSLPKLPKLRTVIAIGTGITQTAAAPGISLYTAETIEQMMKSARYFRTQGDLEGVLQVFSEFNTIYRKYVGMQRVCTPGQLTLLVDELEAVICHFKLARRYLPGEAGELLGSFADFISGSDNHLHATKLKVIDMLLLNLKNYMNVRHPQSICYESRWDKIDGIIARTENFKIDKVCSLAMESIIHGGGIYDFEQFRAVMLDTFIDRMNLSSECYEDIDFQELHESLSTIQNRTDVLPERRASAENVKRFVELFM